MRNFSLENILKINSLENEIDLEQATSIFNKLRVLVKNDENLIPLRLHLAQLIEKYEAINWSDQDLVDEIQLKESAIAETLTSARDSFIQKRKGKIKKALKKNEMNQNDLAAILGHRKNYMSELINGVRPFSQEDLIILNRILNINFKELIFPEIKPNAIVRIKDALKKIDKPQLKLKESDLLELA